MDGSGNKMAVGTSIDGHVRRLLNRNLMVCDAGREVGIEMEIERCGDGEVRG
jgi:hypothetical protein